MKTFAITLAATLIASTSAFAGGGLFDVNETPINYGSNTVQALDLENTASIGVAAPEFAGNVLFDVNEAPINYGSNAAQPLDIEYTASIGGASSEYTPSANTALFDVND